MTPGSGRHRRLRNYIAATTAVVAGHVLIFGLMALELRPIPRLPGMSGAAVMASLVSQAPARPAARPAPQKRTKPLPPSPKPQPAPVAPATAEASPPDDVPQAPQLNDTEMMALAAFDGGTLAKGDPNAPCDLTAVLAARFAASPEVRQALDELPAGQRSVANAIDLWDGQWPAETVSGGKGLLRALLVKAVSAAPLDCLAGDNHGPALIFVPDNGSAAVLAIGSGVWRWSDLIAPGPENGKNPAASASEIAALP